MSEIITNQNEFSTSIYHKILCGDYPEFIDKYIALPAVQRLSGVGLLCGTDWTSLFHNKFFYSRLEHSIGVALIIWNFTHREKQTLAGLFHDISTPAFSHVNDFRKGDALTQEATEDNTAQMIAENQELIDYLKRDGFYAYEINNYHIFPIADNKIPQLSADRLEYMYPSGAALDGIWNIDDIRRNYSDITVLHNDRGEVELGFKHEEAALEYTEKFLKTSLILQHNEDKIAMQLMADIIKRALKKKYLAEEDLYEHPEERIIAYLDQLIENGDVDKEFAKMYRTFRTMKKVEHTENPMKDCYCVSIDVKQRYIDPLVQLKDFEAVRLSKLSSKGRNMIQEFLNFKDTAYGCVPYAE
jgi:HD superfamily phosphohydrolase